MKQPIKILYLEDNPADVELVVATLESEGIVCEVKTASNRESFISSLEGGGFELILSNYALPSFDGISALTIARKKCPDIPFILVSGTFGEEEAIESLKMGATDYVLKQRISRLAPSVRRALNEAVELANRRGAEEALIQRAVMQQEKLREIVHDINNALSPIVSFTELLLKNEPNMSDQARKYLETINTAAVDIANLVKRIKKFYRRPENLDKPGCVK